MKEITIPTRNKCTLYYKEMSDCDGNRLIQRVVFNNRGGQMVYFHYTPVHKKLLKMETVIKKAKKFFINHVANSLRKERAKVADK